MTASVTEPISRPATPRRSLSPSPSHSQRSVSFRVDKPLLIACVGRPQSGKPAFTRAVSQLSNVQHSTTYCGSGIEETVLDLDGQTLMVLDIPHIVDQDGDSETSEEERLLEEHLECAYKGRFLLASMIVFSRITSHLPAVPTLPDGLSAFGGQPGLTLCTTAWNRISSTASWGVRREALLRSHFPTATLTRFDEHSGEPEEALDVLRLAVRATERAPGSKRPFPAARSATVPLPVTPRRRRDSTKSVQSIASSAADDVRSELMVVIDGLREELDQMRKSQDQRNELEARRRRRRRLSLASLRLL